MVATSVSVVVPPVIATPPLNDAKPETLRVPPILALFVTLSELRVATPLVLNVPVAMLPVLVTPFVVIAELNVAAPLNVAAALKVEAAPKVAVPLVGLKTV